MKHSIFFLAFVLAASFGCQKGSDFQTSGTTDQITDNNADPSVAAVLERGGDGGCCCSLVVSSTYFGGLTICGLAPGDGTTEYCDRFCTTSCGMGSGLAKTFPIPKDPTFCIYSGSPFRITNLGILPIQIFFICNGGAPSSPVTIPVGGAVIYTNDCSGTTTLCTAGPCN